MGPLAGVDPRPPDCAQASIHKGNVSWLSAWWPKSLAAHRARLMTASATIGCLRANEVAWLQVGNSWFDYLTAFDVLSARRLAQDRHAA
jgi:hypothetical protein